ncbi:hypothetical protein [Motiliproteus sediminis]|uniref:hypothetical protein n=1 Tax=Motiliproteus sediminis TaxID=1468178 RepID=UPI001AEF4EF3|nr:hypothetical protein [Motiliproteus sediminis]
MSSEKKHSASWNDNIDRAMQQIDRPAVANNSRRLSITLPNWANYAVFLILGMQVSHFLVAGETTHPVADDHDYYTGARVAMLMVAEDIERQRDLTGQLPDTIPGGLGLALNVSYEKRDDGHYVLTYNDGSGAVEFDGRLRQFGLDTVR